MTKLTLLLQTSNGVPIMGLARDDILVFDSAEDETLIGSRDYRAVLEVGLARLATSLNEITDIFVDIGPGGLGVTRTGVAFANALGFALGLPTAGLPAFELLGAQSFAGLAIAEKERINTTVILRKAARPYVHFGIFSNGTLSHYEHCKLEDAQKSIRELSKFNLIGNATPSDDIVPQTNAASMQIMLDVARRQGPAAPGSRAYPIVDVVQ